MNENDEVSKSFWKGIVVGLAAACVVSLLAFAGVRVYQDYTGTGIAGNSSNQSVANEGTVKKVKILENTIKQYFWQDVDEEKLEDGVYKGMLEALDDPYSVYYTSEELAQLEEQTQGVYYGIGAYISMDKESGYAQIRKS